MFCENMQILSEINMKKAFWWNNSKNNEQQQQKKNNAILQYTRLTWYTTWHEKKYLP